MFTKGQESGHLKKYHQQFDRARVKVQRGTVLRQCRKNSSRYTVKWDEKRTPEMLHEAFIEPLSQSTDPQKESN